MRALLTPGARTGRVRAPGSKSTAQRLLIAAALGTSPVTVECRGVSADIRAAADCLRALGAGIEPIGQDGFRVTPIRGGEQRGECLLPCGMSGAVLRFLLPLCGALGRTAVFRREGRLPERPISPLDRELIAHGMTIEEDGALLRCRGKLMPGVYTLPGNVSSQFVSGLLMTLPLLDGKSTLTVTGERESAAYITMTERVLDLAGVRWESDGESYEIPGGQRCALPETVRAGGDWSGAAFFLCMGALSDAGITVEGLAHDSVQADRAVPELLSAMGASVERTGSGVRVRRGVLHGTTIDASSAPDLIPALCALAAAAEGETRVINAGRLRWKESDRLETTAAMLRAVGGRAEVLPDGLVIRGGTAPKGGTVDPRGDHRIAMAAAVAACACSGPVEVTGAECVEKSYPGFWEDLAALKGESK
ncbi:MAG: 3-phosphoshikimate 1-carboxyvinyltransferase [Oscillospiraceae bacterium]|nr:3-phosphoshikimate 1-carboxyvinyltransferase [Oscillospiraceae bacterium]